MSLITVSDLTFGYDGSHDLIFEHVSFQLDTNWRLGLVGRNGRGKTTLLRLLMGELEYRGRISAQSAFAYFPFPVRDPAAPALEAALSAAPKAPAWRLRLELGLLEVGEEALARPFNSLSAGEQTKILLAALFLREDSFLLIDEPTNHLDIRAREILSRYLRKKESFLLVSHDRSVLDGCTDHILSINPKDITLQKGNFSSWMQNKAYEDQHELAENQRLKKDVKRLEAAARRGAMWSDAVEKTKYGQRNSGLRPDRGYIGHKSAKLMKRAKSADARRQKALEEKSSLLKNLESAPVLAVAPLLYHAKTLLEIRDLCVAYPGKPVCQGVSFTLRPGERLALTGKNGAGKSTILKLLTGRAVPYTGSVQKASGLIISYMPQDASFLTGSLKAFAEENAIDTSLFFAVLRKLDFSRTQLEKDMSIFSSGQKKKALLAKSLCQRAHLYLWDEPLNFIDLFSRMQIESLLLEHQPSMLFVEHDSAFVQAVSTGRVALE